MARIKYVGKKDISVDSATGTVWSGHGDVQEVPDEAAPKLLQHAHWVLDDAAAPKATKAKKEDPPPVTLIGTDKLPAEVDIAEGKAALLGDIVAGAHAESGLSADEWNELEQSERDELIQAHLESLRKAFTAPPAAKKVAAKKSPGRPRKQ